MRAGSSWARSAAIVGAGLAIAVFAVACVAETLRARVDSKVEALKKRVAVMVHEGADPTEIVSLMKKAKAAFEAGDVRTGERLLDTATNLSAAYAGRSVSLKQYSLPVSSGKEISVDLYGVPQVVSIDGYDDECMEPCVTGDGQYLFFNNSNDGKVDTHIHFAKRVGPLRYKHLGILPGTHSVKGKDMAPSIDKQGNFYYTCTRTYDDDMNSLYVGTLARNKADEVVMVGDTHPVAGHISPTAIGAINMDCGVSAEGKTLVLSRAQFDIGMPAPRQSDLIIARRQQVGAGGKFVVAADSNELLKEINTPALEYAPALSDDELELYFTRASELMVGGKNTGAAMRIMVATRRSKTEPFATPKVISAFKGFVEAPTFTSDRSEMFVHQKIGGKCRIVRALRNKLQGSSTSVKRQRPNGLKNRSSTL